MNKNVRIGLLLFAVIALIGIPQSTAHEIFKVNFTEKYGTSGTRIDTCLVCHTTENPYVSHIYTLNPYGTAAAEIITFNYTSLTWTYDFPAIEGLDSDGDGILNGLEIYRLTYPGISSDPTESTLFVHISCSKKCIELAYGFPNLIRLRGVDKATGSSVDITNKINQDAIFKFDLNDGVYVVEPLPPCKWCWTRSLYFNLKPSIVEITENKGVIYLDINLDDKIK